MKRHRLCVVLRMQKDWSDGLMAEGERLFTDDVKTPQDNQLNPKQGNTKGTSVTYDGVTVHVNFSEDGKKLDELLINYFKSLN